MSLLNWHPYAGGELMLAIYIFTGSGHQIVYLFHSVAFRHTCRCFNTHILQFHETSILSNGMLITQSMLAEFDHVGSRTSIVENFLSSLRSSYHKYRIVVVQHQLFQSGHIAVNEESSVYYFFKTDFCTNFQCQFMPFPLKMGVVLVFCGFEYF